jgi:CelD/BcsL family acetyltransferase involved in cellulose biosynthesis
MISRVTQYEDFLNLKQDWNTLLQSSEEADSVFLRHEWLDVWWRAFGEKRELCVLLHRPNGQLKGIAPFMLFNSIYKNMPYRRLGFIEDANAPSANFIIQQGFERTSISSFLQFILGQFRSAWDVAILNKIPTQSINYAVLIAHLNQSKSKHIIRQSQNSPYIPVNGEWDTFLKSTAVKFRKQLRNKANKIQRAGEVSFEQIKAIHSAPKVLGETFKVSSKSWKHQEGTSMVSTAERRRFFTLLSKVAEDNGWLSIWLLRLNNEPIALEYHLEYMGRTHAMRGDFDESYRKLSPGSVLEAHIVEHCFRNRLKEYDFCGLDYKYKTLWTEYVHNHNNILLYNSKLRSQILYALQKYFPLIRETAINLVSRNLRSDHSIL